LISSYELWSHRYQSCSNTRRVERRASPQKALASLLGAELALVEGEFFALKNVAVGAAGLSGAGRDGGKEATLDELVDQKLLELAALLALLNLALHLAGAGGDGVLSLTLGEEVLGKAVVGRVVSLERGGVDLDDATLHQSLGAHKLVVGGVVHNIQDLGLGGMGLGCPGEGSLFEAECTALGVATEGADQADDLRADTGSGGGAAELEFALLLVNIAARTCKVALVPGVTSDTHLEVRGVEKRRLTKGKKRYTLENLQI